MRRFLNPPGVMFGLPLLKNLAFLLLVLPATLAFAQQDTTRINTDFIDETDLAKELKGADKLPKDPSPQQGKLIYFVVPIVGSNPAMGFSYGLGGTGAIYLGDPKTTTISSLTSSLMLTTKDQFLANLRGTIMTKDNTWEMLVDLKYAVFTENTYGLGSDDSQPIKDGWNLGGVQTTGIGGAQLLEFNQVKAYLTALKQFYPHLYLGIGYQLDWHTNIRDIALDTTSANPVITSHYAYNKLYGFSTRGYTSSGSTLNIVYDNRDHTLNPYKGAFLQMSYRVNTRFLGSSDDAQQLYLEARYYKNLDKKRPRHLIGFWGIGQFVTSGHLPYMHLPANAYDMRNRIDRGYVAGRFRGPSWVTVESEYRFPITRNGLLGGVAFVSATTVSRDAITVGTEYVPKLGLFEAIRTSAGLGARLMLNRTGRLNLAVDMAFGEGGAKGFYFAVGETF